MAVKTPLVNESLGKQAQLQPKTLKLGVRLYGQITLTFYFRVGFGHCSATGARSPLPSIPEAGRSGIETSM